MAEIGKNFISLVALGRPNPQILNVDFLKDNKIVPTDEPPFDKLFQQEKPFTRFISTPVVSNLVLGNIEITVDEARFQIRDIAVSNWTETKIFDIAKKYFKVLPHTPLNAVGINLSSTITFTTNKETADFQQFLLPKNSGILKVISADNISANLVLLYPYGASGRITLMLNQPKNTDNQRIINFNYEFDFTDWSKFADELEKVPEIGGYCDSILSQLLKAI